MLSTRIFRMLLLFCKLLDFLWERCCLSDSSMSACSAASAGSENRQIAYSSSHLAYQFDSTAI